MAFLDNSGTIILDAILTDIGRKRMAQGNFRVSKFIMADDELDYSLVDVDSADFSKLETLSFFEAFNAENAVITYDLKDHSSDDILYIPQIKVNEKRGSFVKKYTSEPVFYYISVNDETTSKLKSLLGSSEYFLENYNVDRTKLVFESGIDNSEIPRDKLARERYILNYNLLDRYFIINCDNRFIDKLLIIKASEAFYENDPANNIFFNFEVLQEAPPVSLDKILKNFNSYIAVGVDNNVFSYTTGADNIHSSISGPRGTICGINLILKKELSINTSSGRDFRYSKFGQTDQILFGGSDKFDLIDTTIYVQGISTSARLQIPIRILRYAGT
jgi:hypothetical protein